MRLRRHPISSPEREYQYIQRARFLLCYGGYAPAGEMLAHQHAEPGAVCGVIVACARVGCRRGPLPTVSSFFVLPSERTEISSVSGAAAEFYRFSVLELTGELIGYSPRVIPSIGIKQCLKR